MIKAVIFDIDGTLIDTVDLHAKAWQETFRHFGHDIAFEDIRRQIGKGADQLMPVFLSPQELEKRGAGIETWRKDLFKRKYRSQARPFPRAHELLERVRSSGSRLAFASSAAGDELAAYKRLLRAEDLVDVETSSSDAEYSKPHPDIFAAALERLQPIAATEAIVVGDTPYDAEAAGKIGLKTVGVLCGGFPEADLGAAGCVAIYRDPADLLERFDRSPLAPPGDEARR